jgi:hypothetical protein
VKIPRSYPKNHGLTLLETVVVVFVLVVLAALIWPPLEASRRESYDIRCNNNLKQVGLAFRIWEGDNNDRYPMSVSVTNGGAMETALSGNPIRVFQVMSNELSVPEILVCPADKYSHGAPNFDSPLTRTNISYFINPDAIEVNPQHFMCGDDNFEIHGASVKSGLLTVSSNTPIAWSAERHEFRGNISMADGDVQGMNNAGLAAWLSTTNFTLMRLAIP